MVACLLPTAAFASTNGKTADDAINWVKSLEGQPVGNGECVELIKAYYSYLGQTSPGGNGADYSWNQLPAGWHRLQNAQPQKGDILRIVDADDWLDTASLPALLNALETAAADLRARMADPAVAADYAQIAALGEELADNERRTEDTMEQWAQDQQTLEELGE